eukprot:s2775_g4.t1
MSLGAQVTVSLSASRKTRTGTALRFAYASSPPLTRRPPRAASDGATFLSRGPEGSGSPSGKTVAPQRMRRQRPEKSEAEGLTSVWRSAFGSGPEAAVRDRWMSENGGDEFDARLTKLRRDISDFVEDNKLDDAGQKKIQDLARTLHSDLRVLLDTGSDQMKAMYYDISSGVVIEKKLHHCLRPEDVSNVEAFDDRLETALAELFLMH